MGHDGSRAEAERLLAIAEKLLAARDLVGSKKFAERALDSDPLLDGVDQILAVADVLLASRRRMNNHIDWYAVLQIEPSSSDLSTVKRHYRRLALLLHPDKNQSSGADHAFNLVADAWSIISDPSKKALFDRELSISTAHFKFSGGNDDSEKEKMGHSTDGVAAFWTACPQCCKVYQYDRGYEGRRLQCRNCRKAFHAAEMRSPPPIVPGTDMYYCSWGLFPLGFPGGPVFHGIPGPAGREHWRLPIGSVSNQPEQLLRRKDGPTIGRNGDGESKNEIGCGKMKNRNFATEKGTHIEIQHKGSELKSFSKKKKVAVKPPKKQMISTWKEGAPIRSGVDINVEPDGERAEMDFSENTEVMGETLDMTRFVIDLDATEEILGNLSNLPFLKAGEQYARQPLFHG